MRPFDLEAAKRGCPIQSREGKPSKFLLHVPEADRSYRVVALVGGEVNGYAEDGRLYEEEETWRDLLMAPLCQVEGRDVYSGDVLYHQSGGKWIEFVVDSPLGNGSRLMNQYDHWIYTSELTWTKPKIKRVGWINVYPDAGDVIHSTEEEANGRANVEGRLACVRVEYEV